MKDRFQTFVDEVLHILGQDSICEASALGARTVQVTRLEARVLMSASPMAMVAEAVSVAAETGVSIMTAEAPEANGESNADEFHHEADGDNFGDNGDIQNSSGNDSAGDNLGAVDTGDDRG
ncbi:MAG TPA: hypothetical protein PLN33_01840 [Hyphomonadaceae bacterium]|nr:hypothetical protein [Hyphomonadaceae bacterium]